MVLDWTDMGTYKWFLGPPLGSGSVSSGFSMPQAGDPIVQVAVRLGIGVSGWSSEDCCLKWHQVLCS